jgi:hypothetical protein
MATVSNYALRVPPSMMEELRKRAEEEKSSVNQLILVAVAEKLAVLRARDYFASRRARAVPGDFNRILAKAGIEPPREGEEIPEGWLEEADDEASPSKPPGP